MGLASFYCPGQVVILCLFSLGLLLLIPKEIRIIGLVFIGLAIGQFRYYLEPVPDLSAYYDQEIEQEVVISSQPDRRINGQRLTVRSDHFGTNLLVTAPLYPAYNYGDRLIISGYFQAVTNFAEFDYKGYLERYGIYGVFYQPRIEKIGQDYEILKSGIKPYACCRQHHTAIDAALEIRNRHAPSVDAIERILHRTFLVASRGSNPQPTSVSAAKYSAPFSIATALVAGRAWRQDYTIEKLADEKIMTLAAKVAVEPDPELEKLYDFKWPSILEVFMQDGRTFKARRDLPKGEPEYPLTDEEVKEKFMDLADDAVSPERAEEIYQQVWHLENLADISALSSLLRIG